jgi:hypothetical protein
MKKKKKKKKKTPSGQVLMVDVGNQTQPTVSHIYIYILNFRVLLPTSSLLRNATSG